MNRQMNLPALQRIAMEFEKENDMMDQRQEMMDDAVDEAMGAEDEEESDEVVNQVMDELGIDLGSAVSMATTPFRHRTDCVAARRNSYWHPEECSARRASGTSYWWGGSRRRRPASSPGQPETVRVWHIQFMMRRRWRRMGGYLFAASRAFGGCGLDGVGWDGRAQSLRGLRGLRRLAIGAQLMYGQQKNVIANMDVIEDMCICSSSPTIPMHSCAEWRRSLSTRIGMGMHIQK
jgi:hypothetical protein